MYPIFRLLGLSAATLHSENPVELVDDNSSDRSSYSMLDGSYVSIDDIQEPMVMDAQHVPEQRTETIALYRRWLALVFGNRGSSPSEVPIKMRETSDGWTVIEQISRKDKVFGEIWDPAVSGDWSEALTRVVSPSSSAPSPISSEDHMWSLTSDKLSLLRWAFKTDDEDSLQRDLDRISIWRQHASQWLASDKLSYVESVVLEIDDSITSAIARDIERTKPADLHQRMARLLHAYAARNPAVGFCQGMTYIVSALLQTGWMSDEEAFDILCALIEGVNRDYYDDGLTGLHSDLRRLEKFMFYKSGNKLSVPIELVLVEPMMCLFTRLVPVENSHRIIDVALTHGRTGLFAIYLALVELLQPELDRAVEEADSPSMAIIDGAVAFKFALVQLLTEECDILIRRAEGFLLSHRTDIDDLIRNDISIERDDDEVELVLTTSQQPRPPPETSNMFKRLRAALVSSFFSDDESDGDVSD